MKPAIVAMLSAGIFRPSVDHMHGQICSSGKGVVFEKQLRPLRIQRLRLTTEKTASCVINSSQGLAFQDSEKSTVFWKNAKCSNNGPTQRLFRSAVKLAHSVTSAHRERMFVSNQRERRLLFRAVARIWVKGHAFVRSANDAVTR